MGRVFGEAYPWGSSNLWDSQAFPGPSPRKKNHPFLSSHPSKPREINHRSIEVISKSLSNHLISSIHQPIHQSINPSTHPASRPWGRGRFRRFRDSNPSPPPSRRVSALSHPPGSSYTGPGGGAGSQGCRVGCFGEAICFGEEVCLSCNVLDKLVL